MAAPGPLPPDFLFGVATADHQCEAYDPRWEDSWDHFERQQHVPARGRAVDFWTRFPEDIRLAAALGCRLFRFSVAWARLEPRPGVFDEAVLDHYEEVVDLIRAEGMEPMLTLHHYVWPQHLEADGGMLASGFPHRFAAYAEVLARRFKGKVKWWITFNEPSELPFGYLRPWWQRDFRMPPGLPGTATPSEQMEAVATLIRNLFLANARARHRIREHSGGALVGANPLLLGLPAWVQRLIDWRASKITSLDDLDVHGRRLARRTLAKHSLSLLFGEVPRALSRIPTLLTANWWHLGMQGRLPEFLCPVSAIGQQDFVGFDYYWGVPTLRLYQAPKLLEAASGHFDRAPVWPRVLRHMIRRFASEFPDQPIVVIENGCVERAGGLTRGQYIARHIEEIQHAVAEGAPVAGYVCWSITSSREWGVPFHPGSDFGLYHVGLDTDPELKRIPTPAAAQFKAIVTARSAKTSVSS